MENFSPKICYVFSNAKSNEEVVPSTITDKDDTKIPPLPQALANSFLLPELGGERISLKTWHKQDVYIVSREDRGSEKSWRMLRAWNYHYEFSRPLWITANTGFITTHLNTTNSCLLCIWTGRVAGCRTIYRWSAISARTKPALNCIKMRLN